MINMVKNEKDLTYINAVCVSLSQKLVGSERIRRMAEAKDLNEAFDILRESSFGGQEGSFTANQFGKIIRAEEDLFYSFVKEYAPNEVVASFCLLPNDFYNAQALVKSFFMGLESQKYLSCCGIYTIEELTRAVKENAYSKAFCPYLKEAIEQSQWALKQGKGGMEVGNIFAIQKYKALKKYAPQYLKQSIIMQIDLINTSVCLRAQEDVKGMLLEGGSLTELQLNALIERDQKKLDTLFTSHQLKEVILNAVKQALNEKPLVELENTLYSLQTAKLLEERFVQTDGTFPFMLYYYRRKNQISCVQTVLTGKANGHDVEQIKRRILVN